MGSKYSEQFILYIILVIQLAEYRKNRQKTKSTYIRIYKSQIFNIQLAEYALFPQTDSSFAPTSYDIPPCFLYG